MSAASTAAVDWQLLTVAEVMAWAKVEDYRWVTKNAISLGGFHIGREWRFTQAGLESYVRQQQEDARQVADLPAGDRLASPLTSLSGRSAARRPRARAAP